MKTVVLPAGWREESQEVYYTSAPVAIAGRAEVEALKSAARRNPRLRCRLCTHPSPADGLHEMLIAHHRDAYFHPHLHRGRSVSFYLFDGEMSVVLFHDDGSIASVHDLADASRDGARPSYIRVPEATYYAFLVRSEFAVFFEVTRGPFDRGTTVWADWSPHETDPSSTTYTQDLRRRVAAARA